MSLDDIPTGVYTAAVIAATGLTVWAVIATTAAVAVITARTIGYHRRNRRGK